MTEMLLLLSLLHLTGTNISAHLLHVPKPPKQKIVPRWPTFAMNYSSHTEREIIRETHKRLFPAITSYFHILENYWLRCSLSIAFAYSIFFGEKYRISKHYQRLLWRDFKPLVSTKFNQYWLTVRGLKNQWERVYFEFIHFPVRCIITSVTLLMAKVGGIYHFTQPHWNWNDY